MRIASFNVNGIRAAFRKGFLPWLTAKGPDILCLQEIRARSSQIPSDLYPLCRYHSFWHFAEKPGYSGTAILSQRRPIKVERGFPHDYFDQEGRLMIATYPELRIVNCYFPNGNSSDDRLTFKLSFYEIFLKQCESLMRSGPPMVLCCDLNTAHTEKDLANPRANMSRSGFLPEERAWVDRLLSLGFVDAFRERHKSQTGAYSWWSAAPQARELNLGWRFDYVFVQKELSESLLDASILTDVRISDHAPVTITLNDSTSFSGDRRCLP